MSQEIQTIQQSLNPLVNQADQIKITNDDELKQAVIILSELNKFNDKIQEEKEKVTKPLNEALKAERARWKPTELQNEEAIYSIRAKMIVYQTDLIQKRKEKEESITEKLENNEISLNTAVRKLESLSSIEKEVATDVGLVQFREKKQLKIVDIEQIPHHYMIPNEDFIFKELKEGVPIPGCELEIIQVPVNYR